MGKALDTAVTLARNDPRVAPYIFEALAKPFAAGQWEDARKIYRVNVAYARERCGPHTIEALRELEPDCPWAFDLLRMRQQCYAAGRLGALADQATRDWKEYQAAEPQSLAKR